MSPKVLVIDDQLSVLSSFQLYLEGLPITLIPCSSPDEAIKKFRASPQSYACAFVDYLLVNEFGEQEAMGHKLAEELKKLNPDLYVIMMSGDESKEALQTWLSTEVEKFIYKPLKEELISTFIEYALALYQEKHPKQTNRIVNHHGLSGVSNNIKQVVRLSKKFAPTDEAVLITGETGTGKELIAKAIHKESRRADQLFIPLNCAALTSTLFESELFGHVKGAFTGADSNKLGKFREADGGTIFLDEIHHLSLKQQAKILRVIQEKAVMPVGDTREYEVDFRLICASKPNLRELSMRNKFLLDLFFRISSLNIDMAPLRDRKDDIEPLINLFQKTMGDKLGTLKQISPTALKSLIEYSWPGNVRELHKIMCELYFVVERKKIRQSDLPKSILEDTSSVGIEIEMTMPDLEQQQRQQKRILIKSVMKRMANNKSKAAEILNMKRSTLIWLMKDLEIYDSFENNAQTNKVELQLTHL